MPFSIIRNDITKLKVDAVVNAANTALQMGGGVCGAIFSAAGAERLQNACDDLAPIETGEAVITQGFNLPAKYIVHTAGPVYKDGKHDEEELLRACYTNSLEVATKHGCESVAFPLISSGIYGYPKTEALRVATSAIRDYLHENDIAVSIVVFDKMVFEVSKDLLGAVESYVDEHYIKEHTVSSRSLIDVEEKALTENYSEIFSMPKQLAEDDESDMIMADMAAIEFDDLVGNLDEPFSNTLLRLIDNTGKKDADVYRRANIDRRLFSKIKSNENYTPSKPTVIAFAVALELTVEQTKDLLERAGFALSRSRKFDVIVEYFIQSRKYDIFQINEVLFTYDQPLLGG